MLRHQIVYPGMQCKQSLVLRSLAVVSAVALVFGVAATQTAANAAPKTVYIAYQGPLSGGEASTGTDEQNAVKYAIKLFNAKNKAKYNVKLVSIDDQGDPGEAESVRDTRVADGEISTNPPAL